MSFFAAAFRGAAALSKAVGAAKTVAKPAAAAAKAAQPILGKPAIISSIARPAPQATKIVQPIRQGIIMIPSKISKTQKAAATAGAAVAGSGAAVVLTGTQRGIAAAKAAVGAARSSRAVSTAAKTAIVGGGIAAGGTLAGIGIQKAIVEPFEDLGLVTTDESGNPQLTTTGKLALYILGAIVLTGTIGFIAYKVIKN